MPKKNKIILSGIIIIILVAAIAGIFWQQGFLGSSDKRLLKLIQDKPELVELFNKAQNTLVAIKKEPEKASLYFDMGLYWKSVAELGGGDPFFQKSLESYEAGIEKFGQKNILFYLNGGKLAERLADYAKAELYFKKAIEISSADESGYLYLVDLYSYKMNKTEEEILRVFEQGLKSMVNTVPLIAARASYLRRIGDYKMALEDYKILSENYPNNQGYKEVIRELEEKIR